MPITLNGTTGITSPGGDTSTSLTTSGLTIGTTALGAGDSTRFKNRIINGSMTISQRGTSFTNDTTGTQYSLDRWLIYGTSASKFTVTQSATAPTGFSNSFLVTSSAATTVGASDVYEIIQRIEGFNFADIAWGTANAKTITLSFQVYSSLTGTFGGAIVNSANTRSYPFSYSIPVANTWTQISVTIAGDTTGTWIGSTNGIGVQVIFGLGVGSTYSGTVNAWAGTNYSAPTGAVSVVSTNGATWYITGVQLEVGSSATGFDYRDYTTELAMCQRYFWKLSADGTAYPSLGAGICVGASDARINIQHPVFMRTVPTYVTSGTTYLLASTSAGIPVTSISASYSSNFTSMLNFQVSTGLTAGNATVYLLDLGATSFFSASAEL